MRSWISKVQSNLSCMSFQIAANKNHTTFSRRAQDTGKLKNQGNVWLPRLRKECAPEFKMLADYVIPRNKHEQIFQRLQNNAWAQRPSAISSLQKICECLFNPNCQRKIISLLVNNIQVTIIYLSRFSILCDKWRQQTTSDQVLYWMKFWHVNVSIKIYSLSPSHVWKLSSFF